MHHGNITENTSTSERKLSFSKESYTKLVGGGGGLEGMLYQMQLIALSLLRLEKKEEDFKIATEWKQAHPVDDLVIQFSEKILCVQAKYRAGTRQIINNEDFFGVRSKDFALEKYYDFHSKFQKDIPNSKRQIILCTNASLSNELEDDFISVPDFQKDLLYTNGARLLKFRESSALIQQLKETKKCSNIGEFLTSFSLITNHPRENKFDELLCEMLSDEQYMRTNEKGLTRKFEARLYLSELQKTVLRWIIQKEGTFYDKSNVKKIFDEIRYKMCAIKIQEHTEEFCKPYNNVSFQEMSYANIENLLDSCNKEIIIIKNNKSQFTSCSKMFQIIKRSGRGYIFNSYEKLKELEKTKGMVANAAKHELIRVIIISHNIGDIEEEFLNILSAGVIDKKRVIIIITSNIHLEKIDGSIEMEDNDCNFSAFSQETQESIIKSRIMLNNESIAINNMISSEQEHILEERIVSKILQGEIISIGEISAVDCGSSDYYIEKKLIKSGELVDSSSVLTNDEKIILISSEAGYGKTSLLMSVARNNRKFLNEPSPKWVVWVSLNDHCEFFNKKSLERKQINEVDLILFILYAIRFKDEMHKDDLKKILKEIRLNKNHQIELRNVHANELIVFEIQCFIHFYNSGNVTLLLDGYDEIAPHYKDTVKSYIGTIRHTKIRKTIITSRPYIICTELQNFVNAVPYELGLFSTMDQKNFLGHFWKYKRKNEENPKISHFADILLKMIDSSEDTSELFKVPFHTKLIGEMFYPFLEEFLSTKINIEQLHEIIENKIEIINLYEHFLRTKIKESTADKGKMDKCDPENISLLNLKYKEYMEIYKKLAMQILFKNCDNLLSQEDRRSIENSVNEGKDKNGLLYSIDKFAHKSIAEYLSALWIYENTNKSFAKQVFISDYEFIGVRKFLDHIIIRSYESDKKISFLSYLKTQHKVLSHDTFLDKYGRNMFYFIMEYGTSSCLRSVLDILVRKNDRTKYLHHKDKFGITPVSWAVSGNYFDKLEILVNAGCDFDIQRLNVDGVIVNDHLNLFMYVFRKGININKIKKNGDTYLHLAAKNGSLKIAAFICQHIDEKLLNKINDDLQTPLLCAITKSDCNLVRVLAKSGININEEVDKRKSPLMYSCEIGDFASVEILIKYGAHIEDKCNELKTALMYSCQNGDSKSVEMLVQKGANIHAKCNKGKTPLMYSCERGDSKSVEILIQNGAKINEECNSSKTVFMYACRKDDYKLIKILIQNGGNINEKYQEGRTSLMYSCQVGDYELVEILIQNGANIHEKCNIGNTALLYACKSGDSKLIDLLIQNGVNINEKCSKELTALMYFCKWGGFDIVKFLIQKGANVNERSDEGLTPLMYSSKLGDYWLIKILIKNGANINEKCNEGLTALMYSCTLENYESFNLLIQKGANIHEKCNKGLTALMYTCKLKYYESVQFIIEKCSNIQDYGSVKLLIQNGANINEKCNKGLTALMYSCKRGDYMLVELLIQIGANINKKCNKGLTELMYSCKRRDYRSVEFLIQNGANITEKCNEGLTALIYSCKIGGLVTVKLLIQSGSNINEKCNEGLTALMYSCNRGDYMLVELLIQNCANIHEKCNNGLTALMYSCKRRDYRSIEFLIQNGANIHEKCNKGLTALTYCRKYGDNKSIQLLMDKGATSS